MTDNKELKIMIIGSSGAGKTSFVQRWTKAQFSDNYKATIISDFGFKIINYNNELYRITLWDIGGQDKSASMAKIFGSDSHGCIVLTDILINEAPQEIFKWKEIVNEVTRFIDNEKIPFLLIGNKIDLITNEEDKKKIDEKTKDMCNNYGFLTYFLTSAKENINVEESMNYLINYIIERMKKFSEQNGIEFGKRRKDSVRLAKENHIRKEKNNCCK